MSFSVGFSVSSSTVLASNNTQLREANKRLLGELLKSLVALHPGKYTVFNIPTSVLTAPLALVGKLTLVVCQRQYVNAAFVCFHVSDLGFGRP